MPQVIHVEASDLPQRIDSFLSIKTEFSRSKIALLIKEKKVRCNGSLVKANYKVSPGDIIKVGDYTPRTEHIIPVKMDLSIVYEDESMLIVDKPRGLAVHAGKGIYTPTLINGLYDHIKPLKPGLVHRIDKNTSGLLAVAKNDNVHNYLAAQLLDKTMSRHYYAIVDGIILEPTRIDSPLGVDSTDTRRMKVDPNGKEAITLITPLTSTQSHTLVECELLTGRTHQIRVHLASIGHPIIEDNIYNKNYPEGSGQYLFAYSLHLKHPKEGRLVSFKTDFPEYFKLKLEALNLK